MARGDIKAGGAYVELGLKDAAFTKGLRAAGKQLQSLGTGFATVGASIMGVGASIAGALAVAVNAFADWGSALNDMSARTGASAQALAELGYAASQTGASAEDVEKGIGAMQKKITEAASGSKSAREALEGLGLSVEALASMSPEQQFEAIGKALNGIQDPTKRAAMAMEILGKSGKKLTPMLADLDALRQKARDLNIVPDDSQVALADRLGDALDDLKAAAGGVVFQIGAALAGAVTDAAQVVTGIVVTVSRWVKQNQGLVVTIAKVGAAVMVAGAAITGLGLAIAGAGVVLSGLAAGITAVGTVLGVILSPLGLLATALIGGGVAWAKFTTSGQNAVAAVTGFLATLLQTVRDTFGGIADAIMGGDLDLAGRIAMAGLKVALLQGVASISSAVSGSFGDFLGKLGTKISGGDFQGAWDTAVSAMTATWNTFCADLLTPFNKSIKQIISTWSTAQQKIASGILAAASVGAGAKHPTDKRAASNWSKLITGVDMPGETERDEANRQAQIEGKQRLLEQARADLAAAEAGGGKMINAAGIEQTAEGLKTLIEDLEKRISELGGTPSDVVGDAQAIARDILQGQAAAIQDFIDQAPQRAEESQKKFEEDIAGGKEEADSRAAEAKAELDALKKQAADARAAKETSGGPKKSGDEEETSPTADKGSGAKGAGTFSAAAAVLLGAGGGAMERTAKATEATAAAAKQIASNTQPGKGQPGQPLIKGQGFGPTPAELLTPKQRQEAERERFKEHAAKVKAAREDFTRRERERRLGGAAQLAIDTPSEDTDAQERLRRAKEQLNKNLAGSERIREARANLPAVAAAVQSTAQQGNAVSSASGVDADVGRKLDKIATLQEELLSAFRAAKIVMT